MRLDPKFIREFLKPNFISYKNATFELNSVGDWTGFDDGAVSAPVDGTGSTAGANLTFTATNSSPLDGNYSALLSKTGALNLQGKGHSLSSVSIPLGFRGQVCALEFFYSIASGTYTAGDVSIWLYDQTNSELIYGDLQNLPHTEVGKASKFVVTFPTKTTTANVRVIIFQASTTTNNYTITFDDFNLFEVENFIGSPVGVWQQYTPILTGFGTVTGSNFWYRQNQTDVEVFGRWTNGTVSATIASISMPTNYPINLNPAQSSLARAILGHYHFNQNSNNSSGYILANDGETGLVYFSGRHGVSTENVASRQNGSGITVSSTQGSVYFKAPISTLSPSIALANSRIEYASNSSQADADDTTSFVNDINGSQVQQSPLTANRNRRIRFKNPIQKGDTIQVQISIDGGLSWEDMQGHHTDTSGNDTSFFQYQTGVSYGFGRTIAVAGSSTDINVYMGRYQFASGAYAAAGTAWAANNFRWRVVKYSNAIPVESGAPEYKESLITTDTSTVSADTYIDVAGSSITLAPGVWDIGFQGIIAQNSISATPTGTVGIFDSSNNLIGNALYHLNTGATAGQIEGKPVNLVARNVRVDVTTTYKVRIRCVVAAASGVVTAQGAANQAGGLTDPDTRALTWARKTTVGVGGQGGITPIYLTAFGNAGTVITSGVTNLDFTTKEFDSHNAWSGTVFTVPSGGGGNYSVHVTAKPTAAFGGSVVLYKNGTAFMTMGDDVSSDQKSGSSGVRVNPGDTLSIRFNNNATLNSGAAAHNHKLTIQRISL